MRKKLFFLVILIFVTLLGFLYFFQSTLFIVCAGIAGIASAYFLLYFPLTSRIQLDRVYPSPFLILVFLSPVFFAIALILMGSFSVILTLLLCSLTIVFFYYFLMVPLALYHTHLEDRLAARSQPYPSVTVIVPAYNEEGYVGKCVEALLEADYPAHKKEIIVVDDGSTDGTYREAKQYGDRGVKVFHKINGGKHSAINYAMSFADGKIIITVDADSIVSRKSIRQMVRRFRHDSDIGAIAGNVKVLNRGKLVTDCQALEYIVGINLFRRALDIFGVVPVVPGCLGAFKKEPLEAGGSYDPDTVTEDFDVTIKTLKLKRTVQASSDAVVYTEAPFTWKDLYHQRKRWYLGNYQTIVKHRNSLLHRQFGLIRMLLFPFMIFSLILFPILDIVVIISIVLGLLSGLWWELLIIFLFFNLLNILVTLFAIESEGEDRRLLVYSPLMLFGYKQFLDLIMLKSGIDMLRGESEWTRVRRAKGPRSCEVE